VRVDEPFELAERVLSEPDRWTADRLKDLVGAGKTRTVRLKAPLAIILAYWTADGLGDGKVRFRSDVYDRDAAVLAALGAEAGIRVKLPPPPGPVEPAVPIEAKAMPVTQVREPEVAAGSGPPGAHPVSRL
jgi:hypothetical protein